MVWILWLPRLLRLRILLRTLKDIMDWSLLKNNVDDIKSKPLETFTWIKFKETKSYFFLSYWPEKLETICIKIAILLFENFQILWLKLKYYLLSIQWNKFPLYTFLSWRAKDIISNSIYIENNIWFHLIAIDIEKVIFSYYIE